MHWEKFKESTLRDFETHLANGRIDELILDLISKINCNLELVTTSSCSGRIVLLEFDLNEGKRTAGFFKKWHRPMIHDEVIAALKEYNSKKQLWFKVEPFILHIAAKNLAAANAVLKKIRAAGIKRGGIQSITEQKIMIEVQGNGSMIFPVVGAIDWVHISSIANEMFEKNLKIIKKLEKTEW